MECRLFTSQLHFGQKDNNTLYLYTYCFYNLLLATKDAGDVSSPVKPSSHLRKCMFATIQELALRQDEFEPRQHIVLTKRIKLPRELFIIFETEKSSAFEKPLYVSN